MKAAYTAMSRVLVLCWLLAAAAASPIDYLRLDLGLTMPAFLAQLLLPGQHGAASSDRGSVSSTPAATTGTGDAGEMVGWFDPRANGGRLLDVSPLRGVVVVVMKLSAHQRTWNV
jgi:hypothetical protein